MIFTEMRPGYKEQNIGNNFDAMVSALNPTLFALEKPTSHKLTQNNQQVVIDFAADIPAFIRYGNAVANHLGANLLQIKPDQFSAQQAKLSITPNMTLTLIGHCKKGLSYLSDNSGNIIYDIEIAHEIHAKMLQSNTPLDTKFTIDLIACQAGSADGNNPAFAERLVNALASYGINNVSVVASPTIMYTSSDGRQSNLSTEEDHKASLVRNRSNFNCFMREIASVGSSFCSLFHSSNDNNRLREAKITFRSK